MCSARKYEGHNFTYKETPTQVFSGEFCEMFRNIYLVEHRQTAASPICADFVLSLNKKTGIVHPKVIHNKISPPVYLLPIFIALFCCSFYLNFCLPLGFKITHSVRYIEIS